MTQEHEYEVLSTEVAFRGRVIEVHKDEVAMPDGETSQRDVVVHPGAVAVVALGERGVLLVNQYRHPVRARLDELPAGLLDNQGESALAAARRELAEEAGLSARTWHVLVDHLSSPGMTDEAVRIYLARGLSDVDRDVQGHEEHEMTTSWVPLDEAVRRVLAGELQNATAVVGLLATAAASRGGFAELRPAGAPWPAGKAAP
ncbi:MAG TPA: NUDIX hydrolase [Mycobacteriales bacterium]|nr:NUDIX hydrolase [Mycobacteriales bacterium]